MTILAYLLATGCLRMDDLQTLLTELSQKLGELDNCRTETKQLIDQLIQRLTEIAAGL